MMFTTLCGTYGGQTSTDCPRERRQDRATVLFPVQAGPMQRPQPHVAEPDVADARFKNERLRLRTLNRLIALEAADLPFILRVTANELTVALPADNVDVLLYEPTSRALVAFTSSDTPLARAQRALGLNRLPLADGGRAAIVFQTNTAYVSRDVAQDTASPPAVSQQLHVGSALFAPLRLHRRRGVLVASSTTVNRFAGQDLDYLMTVSRLLGLLGWSTEQADSQARGAADAEQEEGLRQLLSTLTARQREVAALIARGQTNAQIARQLVVTTGTVANHVADILTRLGCSNRSQVAALAAQAGLQHELTYLERSS
jgi:DNA-binding CsgD family transcriptional regulator